MTSCVEQAWLDLHPEALSAPRRSRPLDKAHPYPMGSGPPGQSCGTCAKRVAFEYHNKTYFKCHVLKASWTHGAATDIRCKDPACRSWEPRIHKIELFSTFQRGFGA